MDVDTVSAGVAYYSKKLKKKANDLIPKLLDKDIRKWIFDEAEPLGDREMFIEEFGISNVRADVVHIVPEGDRIIAHGMEIKSCADSLKRIPMQSMQYSRYFDKCSLYCDPQMTLDALKILPRHWGIVEVWRKFGVIHSRQVRNAKPVTTETWIEHNILWREEILDLIRSHNLQSGITRVSKEQLIEFVKGITNPKEFRQSALNFLLIRTDWRRRDPLTIHRRVTA